jgi:hypothetical protein
MANSGKIPIKACALDLGNTLINDFQIAMEEFLLMIDDCRLKNQSSNINRQ